MLIYEVQDPTIVVELYLNDNNGFFKSYSQGHMGKAYVDDLNKPQSAVIIIGEFYFLRGIPNKDLINFRPNYYSNNQCIMVPGDVEAWADLIEKIYGDKAQKITRYALKKNTTFNISKLEKIVSSLSKNYQLKMVDKTLYNEILQLDWAKDLCINFTSYKQFKLFGIGVVLLQDNKIVAGASSYLAYNDGIEIEVDTIETERRKGLALACSAKLILECLHRNISPSWDAHNYASLHLAQKLGYHLDKSYLAYIIGH